MPNLIIGTLGIAQDGGCLAGIRSVSQRMLQLIIYQPLGLLAFLEIVKNHDIYEAEWRIGPIEICCTCNYGFQFPSAHFIHYHISNLLSDFTLSARWIHRCIFCHPSRDTSIGIDIIEEN